MFRIIGTLMGTLSATLFLACCPINNLQVCKAPTRLLPNYKEITPEANTDCCSLW